MKKIIYSIFIVASLASCDLKSEPEKEIMASKTSLETLGATDLTDTSATCWGKIIKEGVTGVKEYGIEYRDASGHLQKVPNTIVQADSFGASITENVKYGDRTEYRAYVVDNDGGLNMGEWCYFNTLYRPSVYSEIKKNDITSSSIPVYFHYTSEYSEWGVYYSSSQAATTADAVEKSSTNDTILIVNLEPNTRYYLMPYTVSKENITAYGNSQEQITAPVVSAGGVKNITINAATVTFEVSNSSGVDIGDCSVSYKSVNATSWTKVNAGSAAGIIEVSLSSLEPITTYKVYATASNKDHRGTSDTIEVRTLGGVPVLEKPVVTALKSYKVNMTNGKVSTDSLLAVTEYGFCWSTTQGQATVSGSHVASAGVPSGVFENLNYSLLSGTTYYVRTYAKNIAGIGYSEEVTVTTPAVVYGDVEGSAGKHYKTVNIGTQTWMAENLIYNGQERFSATDISNGLGVMCPTGWHIPTEAEISTLLAEVGGRYVAPNLLREKDENYKEVTNSTGFGLESQEVYLESIRTYFWSSTQHFFEIPGTIAYKVLYFTSFEAYFFQFNGSNTALVRCVKNN